jgi:hypothetical protein
VICGQGGPATPAVEKAPTFQPGVPQSDGRYQHQSGKLWKRPPETQALPTADDGAVDHPAALSVCSTGARHVLLLTAKNLLFPATHGAGRPRQAGLPAVSCFSQFRWCRSNGSAADFAHEGHERGRSPGDCGARLRRRRKCRPRSAGASRQPLHHRHARRLDSQGNWIAAEGRRLGRGLLPI